MHRKCGAMGTTSNTRAAANDIELSKRMPGKEKINGRSMETFELSEALPGCNFTARIALDTDMTATKLQSLGGALNSEQAVRIPGCNCMHGIGTRHGCRHTMTMAWWSTDLRASHESTTYEAAWMPRTGTSCSNKIWLQGTG